MKEKNRVKKSKEIVQSIRDIIEESKLNRSITREYSDVINGVFAAIAASSFDDPKIRIAAISGMIEIENIGDPNGWNKR